jgi:hypothetical protein
VSAVREIVVNTFVSLDGVMQAPGDEPSEAELERRAKLEG